MTVYALPLDSAEASQVALTGGKAAPLSKLLRAGFPVPPGLCLTTKAFRLALSPHQAELSAILQQYDLSQPASAGTAAQALEPLLANLAVPSEVVDQLLPRLPDIAEADSRLVVRSSATAEDQTEASFAGQYESVIGVQGQEDLLAAVLTCWRSFFSQQALLAQAHYDAAADHAMAVLIQPLIQAECAGVCFSIDPVEHHDWLVINAAWGLGSGVVDGRVASDTVWLDRDFFRIAKTQIAEKPTQIGLVNGDLRAVPVPEERRRAACLPEPWLKRLAEFAIVLEQEQGRPQDVEWAIAANRLWILQSRPITALPSELAETPPFPVAWEDDATRQSLWRHWARDDQPVAQYPLELDLHAQSERTREEACRLMGVEQNMRFNYWNGYIYGQRIPIDWTEADQRVRRAARRDLANRLQAQGLTMWDHWEPEVVAATERLRAFDPAEADGPALADHLSEALAVRRRHYMLHPMMSFNPPESYFKAYVAVAADDANLSESEIEQAAYRLLEVGQNPLTELVDRLYGLAQLALEDEAVVGLITSPPADLLGQLQILPHGQRWLARFEDLLAIYGERTGAGWGSDRPFRTPTWREQPAEVLRLIRPYLDPTIEAPAVTRKRVRQVIADEVEALCAACGDAAAVTDFREQLAYARKTLAVLEIHNHYIDQMSLGQLRHTVMAAANWLVSQGVLSESDDVLWLTFEEILAALQAASSPFFAETITARRAEFARWERFVPPSVLGLPAADLPERPPFQNEVTKLSEDSDPNRLTGQGASPGHYQGRAKVAAVNTELPSLSQGDILVAANIGPMWTPIFPLLGALVLDGGSVGQHAAAIAREYGIPAVVGTQWATRRIADGATVTVDGRAGVVELAANDLPGS